MSYYHIYIALRNGLERYELDKNKKDVRDISEDYSKGRKFLFYGKWLDPNEIEEIRVYETAKPSNFYETDVFYFHDKDVTRNWIKKQPQKEIEERKTDFGFLSKDIFIVHGKDHKPIKELKTMLKEFDLNPIILHEKPSGSRTIVEKLERYSNVGYAFVILTPDDLGTSHKAFNKYNDNFVEEVAKFSEGKQTEDETQKRLDENIENFIENRARQNVVLEFGYFIGKLGRDRVCCLLKGDVERPSDMSGIVYIPFEESVNEVRGKIVKELKAAGYEIEV